LNEAIAVSCAPILNGSEGLNARFAPNSKDCPEKTAAAVAIGPRNDKRGGAMPASKRFPYD